MQDQPRQRCACIAQHGGSGHYVFLGPDGGHCRHSNYARRVFRPAREGRYPPGTGQPQRLVIADASAWPGVPVATWPSASPGSGAFIPPRGRGIQAIPEGAPLTCWLPVKFGLTPHGLRHSHRTWMAEDGIPEILAEQRLGHEVPEMHGLYAHASDRMRDDLKRALQARWEESLSARAAIDPLSPVSLLDELLAPFRGRTHPEFRPSGTPRDHQAAADTGRQGDSERCQREDDLPNSSQPCRKPQPGNEAGA